MKKYKKKQVVEMNEISDTAKDFLKSYQTVEEKLGEETEDRASRLLSYLNFNSVDVVPPYSIANHELKCDIWVSVGEEYFPLQIKSSEVGCAYHDRLSKVTYTDSKGRKHLTEAPPCLILSNKKKGFDFLKDVVHLFRKDRIELWLKPQYADAFYKHQLLKKQSDFLSLKLLQLGRVSLDATQLLFLQETGLITKVPGGFKL